MLTHLGDFEVKVVDCNFILKFLKRLFLFCMELLLTWPDVGYLSEVLCYTVMTHISGLEVKVVDFEISCSSFWFKF